MSPNEYLNLLTQKYLLLDLIKKIKSPKAKRDRYKQLERLNKKIKEYEMKVYGTTIHSR